MSIQTSLNNHYNMSNFTQMQDLFNSDYYKKIEVSENVNKNTQLSDDNATNNQRIDDSGSNNPCTRTINSCSTCHKYFCE